jgi:hypothetical protein
VWVEEGDIYQKQINSFTQLHWHRDHSLEPTLQCCEEAVCGFVYLFSGCPFRAASPGSWKWGRGSSLWPPAERKKASLILHLLPGLSFLNFQGRNLGHPLDSACSPVGQPGSKETCHRRFEYTLKSDQRTATTVMWTEKNQHKEILIM